MNSVYRMSAPLQTYSADVAIHLGSVGTSARSLSGLTAASLGLVGLLLVLSASGLLLLEIGTLAHLPREYAHRLLTITANDNCFLFPISTST